MTQQDLAERLEEILGEEGGSLTHQKVVSKIENGSHTLTLDVIEVLAEALRIDPIVLLESAFHFTPRNPQEIAQQRMAEFQRRVDRALETICARIEANAVSETTRRVVEALTQLAIYSPEDLPGVAGMVEGLVVHRSIEAAQAHQRDGLGAARHSLLTADVPAELVNMFGEMRPDELSAMLAGFFFQIGATLRFASRLQGAGAVEAR